MTSSRSAALVVGLAALAAFGAGCHGKEAEKRGPVGPVAGAERGACRADRGCDPGLTCLSDLCVRPPAADCAKVGETLAYILLDNYAPREERERTRADIARQCQDQGLSVEDGQCLIRAKDRAEVRACPRGLGFGDCKRIVAHLDGIRGASGVDAYLVTGADRIIARCRTESPLLGFERCVLAARTIVDVESCTW